MGALCERLEDGIAVIRIDRPERRNALDSATLAQLNDMLGELAADEGLRVLVLSTTDVAAFCAGADVGEQLDAEGGVARMEAFAAMYAAIASFPLPTICVCVGDVVGAGAEIAAGCDLRVAGDNLKLAWVGARIGVPVGPARLVPLVGLARAKDLLLTGRRLGADDVLALGLATRTAPASEAEAAALELARAIAAHDPAGPRQIKQLIERLETIPERVALENEVLVDWQRHGAGLPQRR
jgi:enoyl-CoA hydratase/carnithine racemase